MGELLLIPNMGCEHGRRPCLQTLCSTSTLGLRPTDSQPAGAAKLLRDKPIRLLPLTLCTFISLSAIRIWKWSYLASYPWLQVRILI